MKRYELIEKLVNKGLSEKTLAMFNDNQISELSFRMLGEQVKKGSVVMSKSTNTADIDRITRTGQNVELREKLVGKQKNLDRNKNGKLDSEDFKMLRNKKEEFKEGFFGFGKKHKKIDTITYDGYNIDVWSDGKEITYGHPRKMGENEPYVKEFSGYDNLDSLKRAIDSMNKDERGERTGIEDWQSADEPMDMAGSSVPSFFSKPTRKIKNPNFKGFAVNEVKKPSIGLDRKKKSQVIKKAIAGKDIGKKDKGFKEVEKKAKESGAKNPKAVAAAAMWKNIKREDVEVKSWANQLLEKHYHPLTTKREIMDTIKRKLNENAAAPAPSKPKTTPTTKPGTKPGSKPGVKPIKPLGPMKTPGHKPAKAVGGVKNTMFSFDTLKSVAEENNTTTAPSKPKTTPTTKPGTKPGSKPGVKPIKPLGPMKTPGHKPAKA